MLAADAGEVLVLSVDGSLAAAMLGKQHFVFLVDVSVEGEHRITLIG